MHIDFISVFTLIIVFSVILGASAAERISWLKKSPLRQGLFLGLFSVPVLFFATNIHLFRVFVGMVDFPVLIASLFFAPAAGLAAGLVAVAAKALSAIWVIRDTVWLCGCATTVLICLYSLLVSKLSLNQCRPSVAVAFIAAAFGEFLQTAFLLLTGLLTPSYTFESVRLATFPMVLGGGLCAALFALICLREDQSKRFFASNNITFVVFGLVFLIVVSAGAFTATHNMKTTLQNGIRDFDRAMSEHIAFAMHRCSRNICRKVGDYRTVSCSRLDELAKDHSLDEVNIISAEGRLLQSSRPAIMQHKGKLCSDQQQIDFYKMAQVSDSPALARKALKKSWEEPYEETCFIEIPFPDRAAFLRPGYRRSSLIAEFETIYIPHLSEKKIGSNGYFLIADSTGKIAGPVHNHPDAIGKTLRSIGLSAWDQARQGNTFFSADLFGERVQAVRFKTLGKWDMYACLPYRDEYIPVVINVTVAGVALLILAFLFNWLMLRMEKMRAERDAHMEQDLLFAHNIQAAELKEDAPDTPQYKVSAVMLPAKVVGGDFYDYYNLENGKIVIGIADVSGKGMPAAIFMMKAKTSLKLYSYRCDNIKDVMEVANNEICSKNETQMFVTCWGGIFDPATGDLDYICAGHNPPLIVRADGKVEWVECHKNLPLGIRYNRIYQPQKLHLNPGDRIFLYTDGVTEAANEKHQLYGTRRLYNVLSQVDQKSSCIDAVIWDLKNFVGKQEQSDDITMLSMICKQESRSI